MTDAAVPPSSLRHTPSRTSPRRRFRDTGPHNPQEDKMTRSWLYAFAAMFLIGAFGDWCYLAFTTSNWQAIGKILAVVSAIALGLSAVVMSQPDDEWPEEIIERDGRISRTQYLSRPDHERVGR